MKLPAIIILLLFLAGCSKAPVNEKERPVLIAWVAISGESMLPKYPNGALVEVEVGVPYEVLKQGDDVIFWDYTNTTGATFIIHELVAKQAGSWIAQGRNHATNPIADRPWVTEDNYYVRATGKHTQLLVLGGEPR